MSFIRLLYTASKKNVRNFNLSSIYSKRIVIHYSNGHEYKNQFMGLQQVLKRSFPNVTVIGEASENRDFRFEVTVDNTLVHSKLKGDGFVDEDSKLKKIIDAVRPAMSDAGKSPFDSPAN